MDWPDDPWGTGPKDQFGNGCSWYVSQRQYCGAYEDDDFFATSMCCACKGR